jgi:hypothetical protein
MASDFIFQFQHFGTGLTTVTFIRYIHGRKILRVAWLPILYFDSNTLARALPQLHLFAVFMELTNFCLTPLRLYTMYRP